MNTRIKSRVAFCPSITEAKLEERIVLSATNAILAHPVLPPVVSVSNFNNGFVSVNSPRFFGFGSTGSAFNTNLGTGSNNAVAPATQHLYLGMISTSGGVQFILR
jgi:hypothetical protein